MQLRQADLSLPDRIPYACSDVLIQCAAASLTCACRLQMSCCHNCNAAGAHVAHVHSLTGSGSSCAATVCPVAEQLLPETPGGRTCAMATVYMVSNMKYQAPQCARESIGFNASAAAALRCAIPNMTTQALLPLFQITWLSGPTATPNLSCT